MAVHQDLHPGAAALLGTRHAVLVWAPLPFPVHSSTAGYALQPLCEGLAGLGTHGHCASTILAGPVPAAATFILLSSRDLGLPALALAWFTQKGTRFRTRRPGLHSDYALTRQSGPLEPL